MSSSWRPMPERQSTPPHRLRSGWALLMPVSSTATCTWTEPCLSPERADGHSAFTRRTQPGRHCRLLGVPGARGAEHGAGTGSRGFSRACRPTRRGDLFLHVIERGCVHRLRLGKPVRFVSSTGSPTGHGPDRPAGRDGCAGPNGPPLAASGRRLWSYWSRRPRSLQGSERETPERSRP